MFYSQFYLGVSLIIRQLNLILMERIGSFYNFTRIRKLTKYCQTKILKKIIIIIANKCIINLKQN